MLERRSMKKPSNDVVMALLTIPSLAAILFLALTWVYWPRIDHIWFYGQIIFYLYPLELITGLIGFFYFRRTSRSFKMEVCKRIDLSGIILGTLGCILIFVVTFMDVFPHPD